MTGCKFGKGVLINSNASIGHDTIVHDFCNINPGVSLAGNILIEECVTIGIGAVVKEGLKIGKNSFIGAGSNVLHDVPENTIAYGNPARIKG